MAWLIFNETISTKKGKLTSNFAHETFCFVCKAQWIWDSSIFYSIQPKTWNIIVCWILCFPPNLPELNLKLFPSAAHWSEKCSILSNKYNPGQPIQKPGFWLFSRPFWIRTTFIWVHQGPPVIVLIFFWNWLLHKILKYVVTNFRK